MKSVLRRIDKAIKRLYNLDFSRSVEEFLVVLPQAKQPGALLVAHAPDKTLEMGIHLGPTVRKGLKSFPRGLWVEWPRETLQAFTVATEEISHFHYVRYHATQGRQVSQLELEMQGEIDKFLIAYFTNSESATKDGFEKLYEQFFLQFRLQVGLDEEEQQRYLEANRLAQRFIRKLADQLQDPHEREAVFRFLRKFYRLNAVEKISQIAA